MQKKIAFLSGKLKAEDYSVSVQIYYASRFSLFVKFNENKNIRDGKRFISLQISADDKSFELGVCRFYLETNIDGLHGRLVFLNDLYNFDMLFDKYELLNLERLSNDLHLLLIQKERVNDLFREYISSLTFDLKIYKHFFDGLDQLLEKEPEPVRSLVHQTVINTEGRKFMLFFDSYLKELEKIINKYSKEEHELHGFYLRKQLWDIILCSEFMIRTNVKPRGYAGDSEMMRMIYENSYRGTSSFGQILYKISLEHPASQAVRNRRIMVPRIMKKVQEEFAENGIDEFRFMSVACGPAYEIQDLFHTDEDVHRFNCTLLDQDSEALAEASNNIKKIEKMLGYKIKANYLKDSVRTMLKTKNLSDIWGTYHYIYSMGLFDYLTKPVAVAVIEKLYSLLKPGGKIFIGNFHVSNPSRWFMEYWHDWVLYYRDEEEFLSLLAKTDAVDKKVIFDDTGSQMFLSATKQ